MAGDIGIDEQVIIIPQAQVRADAQDAGARVMHRYGPRVMIGEVAAHHEDHVRAAEALRAESAEDLDPIGALGLAAFKLRQSPEFRAAKVLRPHKDEPWDTPGLEPPDRPADGVQLLRAGGVVAEAVLGRTSQRMIGSIAVGIIFVSGPNADLQFSAEETEKVIAEVQDGLTWLALQSPAANITWTYDIHSVSVNVQPRPGLADEEKEPLWRNPAMASLGFHATEGGVLDYVRHIQMQYGTRWAYVAYFTKYPSWRIAEANHGGPRVVMQYPNGNWGPDNIDTTFAHETGHIFQAPDEYGGCDCGGSWGVFNKPNGNCIRCAPERVPCLMWANSRALCRYTPWHFGFPWPNGFPINDGDATPLAPAAAVFQNRLYVLWKSNDASNRIFASGSGDGASWPHGVEINDADSTPATPAVCVFNDQLYVFWKANDPSNRMFFSASTNGTSWPGGTPVNDVDSTPETLAACVFNGKVYLFWKANDPSNRIFFSASTDGTSWPNGSPIDGTTPASLAASVFNGKLYLFWKANDPSNRIMFSASADGSTWPAGVPVNEIDSTSSPVAACVENGRLSLFWKANDPTNAIMVSSSSNGQTWPGATRINLVDKTSAAVATALFQNNPYVFWKADDASNQIFYSA